MRNTQLLDKIKAVVAMLPTIGTVGSQACVEVAGAGYERALWIINTGAATTSGLLDFKVQKAAATGMGGAADVSGAAITQLTAVANGTGGILVIDMPVDPAYPFMRAVCTTTTAAIVCGAICLLYKGNGGNGAAGAYPVSTAYALQAVKV